MIADQVEATARAVTPSDAAGRQRLVVQRLARIQEEGQLGESGLSGDELTLIQTALERALQAMHHLRMMYPPAAASSGPPRALAGVRRVLRRGRRSRR